MLKKIINYIVKYLPESNKIERIWILAKSNFRKRYYGSSLGIIWALINPLFLLVIYYFIFNVIFNNQIENFILYMFSGFLIWMFFEEASKEGLNTITSNRYLIENIRIKKLDIYISGLLSKLFALIFNIFAYFLISLFFKIQYSANILFLPILIFNLLILNLGISLIISIISVYLKDFNHFWDLFTLALFWLNPIFYSELILYQTYKIILYLNPVAGIIINTRNVLLNGVSPDFNLLVINFCQAIIILILGLIINKKHFSKVIEIL